MAETLTYEPVVNQGFTEDEMDSIKIGETLQQEQDTLLAGKYENAQQLEKAYLELQTKLGEPKPDVESTNEQPVAEEISEPEEKEKETKAKESNESDILERLWDTRDADSIPPELVKEVSETDPSELVKLYMKYRDTNEAKTNKPTLTKDDVSSLKEMVGGETSYNQMLDWAESNVPQTEIARYDSVMERGDSDAIYFAVQAMNAKYVEAAGKDGQLLAGRPPTEPKDMFRSQAELVEAMSDPRYDNDPAYRQDIIAKLERSKNVNF